MKRLVPVALVAALAVTGVAAGVSVIGADSQPGSTPAATAPASEAASTSTEAAPPANIRAERAQPVATTVDPQTPEHLRLWKFDAPVIPVELDGGTLVPPSDPTVLGWWGQPAGSAKGTTLLVGHTVSTGGGTLDDLEDTTVGQVANVSGVKYRVDRVKIITKAQLAQRAERLFNQKGSPKLVVVTCEGYNATTRTYSENVVVVARPVR